MSQYSPIWDAIDDEQWLYALELIEKAQKRSRGTDKTLLGLQGLCLAKENRVEQAISVCRQIKALAPQSVSTYETIHDVLKTSPLPQFTDYLVETMEAGYKEIKSEVMGRMWFMEAARGGQLSAQRRAAVELQKVFLAREYFYLVLMSMFLLYNSSQAGKEKDLTGMLMYRMICKAASNQESHDGLASNGASSGPRIANVEEFYLYLDILRALNKGNEALEALDSSLGKRYTDNHEFALLRVELMLEVHGPKHPQMQAFTRCQLESGVDDWSIFKAHIDSSEFTSAQDVTQILKQIIDRSTSRNSRLACIYANSKLNDLVPMTEAIKDYLEIFGDKSATFEDIAPFLKLLAPKSTTSLAEWLRLKRSDQPDGKVVVIINLAKIEAQLGLIYEDDASIDAFVQDLLRVYRKANINNADSEDDRSADDSLLLADHVLRRRKGTSTETLKTIALLLEHGLSRSKHNFQFRLSLIDIYRKLGAWSAAHKHFAALSIKQIQRDTLSYILYEDSVHEYVSSMQMTGLKTSQNIYWANEQETPEMICQAYEKGTYSKIAELLLFQRRLRKSSWAVESKIALCRLQMMLDKFDWKQSVDCTLSQPLYDNKSRNVQMLSQQCKSENDDADKKLDEKSFKVLQSSLQTCAMLQAIVRNISLTSEISEPGSHSESVDLLVRKTYALKFQPDPTSLEQLKSYVDDLLCPGINADSYDSVSLHQVGLLLEGLKYWSIAWPQLKPHHSGLKQTVEKLRCLLEEIRGSLESCRRSLASTPIRFDQSIIEFAGISSQMVDTTSKAMRASQTEGITCLLGLAKQIKI